MNGKRAFYIDMSSRFLSGIITPEDFVRWFIAEFKVDDFIYPEVEFEKLDSLFSACDLYTEDQLDEWSVDIKELRKSAEAVVQQLSISSPSVE